MLLVIVALGAAVAAASGLPVWQPPNFGCKDALAPSPRCQTAHAQTQAQVDKWRWKEWPIYAWGGPWGYDSAGEAQPVELEAYAAANFNLA